MNSRRFDPAEQAPPETIVERVLEPEERILWAGRPDLDALTREAREMRSVRAIFGGLVRILAFLAVAFAFWAYTNGYGFRDSLSLLEATVRGQLPQVILAVTVIPAFLGLIHWLHARSAGAFIERARSLTYAVTDRRLLILVDGQVEHAFEPDEVRLTKVRERKGGFADLVLLEKARSGGARGEPLLSREKRRIGFKALPNIDEMKRFIEAWRDAHLASSERVLTDFLERAEEADGLPAPGGPSADTAPGGWRLQGGRYDLSASVPEGWEVQVRSRSKAYGTVFLDVEKWQAADEATGWNVARIDGPFGAMVEIHVDAVDEPTSTLEAARGGTLSNLVAGEVVDVAEEVRRGRFTGWSITRKSRGLADAGSGSDLDKPGFFRMTTVFDGTIQLSFLSRWPEGSEPMRRAVDAIESSVTARSEGAVAQPTGSALASSFGCVGSLMTAARVGFGTLLFGLGVLVGYDQSSRAEAYRGAAADLVATAEAGIPSLPGDEVVTTHDGRLAHVEGRLHVPSVTDSLTGLSVETWRLVRSVEVRQWQEVRETDRTTSSSTPTTTYRYERVWSPELIDSDDFNDPLFGDNEHVNPERKPIPDEIFISGDLALGAWRLPVYTYAWPEQETVPPQLLEGADLAEGWTADSGYLYPPAPADGTELRIAYTYHPRQAERYSLLGIPNDGVIDLPETMAELPLMVPGSVDAATIVAQAAGTERGVQSIWMIYAWVGLLLLIRPIALRIPALERFTRAPFPRRLLTTAAAAGAMIIVLAALMP